MRRLSIFCLFFVFCFSLLGGCASMTESGERYRALMRNIQEGQNYFAVMHLKAIVRDDPHSSYAPSAMFALGEYYFDNGDTFHALSVLSDYIHLHLDDRAVVFAKLLIYKIMSDYDGGRSPNIEEDALIKEIRRELFSEPIFFIFYDNKSPRSYRSLFRNSYLVYDYVDKIKVFRNDKLFLELSP